MAGKMQVYIERLMQSRLEISDDASRKRGLPNEPTDGLDHAKRARLDAMTPPLLKIPPLPPGPTSLNQLFTLTQDIGLSSFDVKQLPPDLVLKIAVPLLAQVNQSLLTQAVDVRNSPWSVYWSVADIHLGCSRSISNNNERAKPEASAAPSCPSR